MFPENTRYRPSTCYTGSPRQERETVIMLMAMLIDLCNADDHEYYESIKDIV